MARPKKTDESVLVSVLDKYYAEEACGNAGAIRFTDLEIYAALQGVPAKEYEFRRNSAVRRRLEELKEVSEKQQPGPELLAYKGLDVEGLVRTSRDPTTENTTPLTHSASGSSIPRNPSPPIELRANVARIEPT